jgi:hypothetical protein
MIHAFMFAASGRAPFAASIRDTAILPRMSIGARPAQGSMSLGSLSLSGIPEDIPGYSPGH